MIGLWATRILDRKSGCTLIMQAEKGRNECVIRANQTSVVPEGRLLLEDALFFKWFLELYGMQKSRVQTRSTIFRENTAYNLHVLDVFSRPGRMWA